MGGTHSKQPHETAKDENVQTSSVQGNKDQAVRDGLPRQETTENNPPPTNSGSVIDQKREDVCDSPLQITKNNNTQINAGSVIDKNLDDGNDLPKQENGKNNDIHSNAVSELGEISTKQEQEIPEEKNIQTKPGSVIDKKLGDGNDLPRQENGKNNDIQSNAVSELGERSTEQEQDIAEEKNIQTKPDSELGEISTKQEQEIEEEKNIQTKLGSVIDKKLGDGKDLPRQENGKNNDIQSNAETEFNSPPNIALKEFNPPKVPWSTIKKRIDVLLITVNDNEHNAATRMLSNAKRSDTGRHLGPFYCGDIGENFVALVRSEPGAIGTAAAQSTVQDAIDELKPKVIVLVGVCFGINDGKQKLGDLVVSTRVAFYAHGRVNKDGSFYNRAAQSQCNARLLRSFQHGKTNWTSPGDGEVDTQVKFGLVISGPQLIDNLERKQQLISLFPEALGGEMEAEGVCTLCERKDIPWIVCKSICDWADGRKNKEWQPYAAIVAASYAKHVMELTYLPELTEEELNGSATTSSFQEHSSSKRTGNKQGDKKDGPTKPSENEQPDGGYATSNEKKNGSRRISENEEPNENVISSSDSARCSDITPHPSTVQPAAKPKEKTDEISSAERHAIAGKISHRWKFVAMLLKNISDEDTKNIACSKYDEDARDKADTMLGLYIERNGTRQELVNALRAEKLLKVADEVEKKTL